MRRLLFLSFIVAICMPAHSQTIIRGKVFDQATQEALPGTSLFMLHAKTPFTSDDFGIFSFGIVQQDTIVVTRVGYQEVRLPVTQETHFLEISLKPAPRIIEEVNVSTGYYQLPKERATGSVVHIGNKLIGRAVGANVLQRLEGMAPGVQFVNANGTGAGDIRVRGLSTFESDETPLIVLDNFPYEGSIDNIDPNSVESITVLKDAAAASIWGAKAGNGVIVITSKEAKRDSRVNVAFNVNHGIMGKPNLFYSQSWLPSATVMEIERERYQLGHYVLAPENTNSYYVELLHAHNDGFIDDETLAYEEARMERIDTRAQALAYLYRSSSFMQYALNINGGTDKYGFHLAVGYHDAKADLIGNDSKRINLAVQNRFSPLKGIEIGAAIAYVDNKSSNNGIGLTELAVPNVGISPYVQLVGENGNPMPIVQDVSFWYAASATDNGLLDWFYRPVEEIGLSNNRSGSNELRVNADIKVKIWKGLDILAAYQFTGNASESYNHRHKESYFVRNLVNSFTQPNGNLIIPHNGVLSRGTPTVSNGHQGRTQLNYSATFGHSHALNALVGGDIRQRVSEIFPGTILYNYHDEYLTGNHMFNYNQFYDQLPSGRRRIPMASGRHSLLTNRDLSYFGNVAYTYEERYAISTSMRWDASNLFGVKTNQKGVPLWSIGGSWDVAKESFYELAEYVPYFRLRMTYGLTGNVNKSVTHYPTIRYVVDGSTGLTRAAITSVGNPSLRWERVNTWNGALDWRTASNRFSGAIERYIKQGHDLIGDDLMDPTTGIRDSYKINYANIETRGWDIQFDARLLDSRFSWKITLLNSWVKNKVTNYNTNEVTNASYYFTVRPPYVVGDSRDVIYAVPWHGLSPEDGLPIVYINGSETKDYRTYYNEHLNDDRILRAGVSVPTTYGSLRNAFAWSGLDVNFLITWKFGYVFRRQSMKPTDEYFGIYHQDYFRRWQTTGDELYTHVPAGIRPDEQTSTNSSVGAIYQYSDVLITSGDHIRLHELNIGYQVPFRLLSKISVKNIRLSVHARNLGILWRANSQAIDPDYASAGYPVPPNYSFGIQCAF